jgi:hypothetical protein
MRNPPPLVKLKPNLWSGFFSPDFSLNIIVLGYVFSRLSNRSQKNVNHEILQFFSFAVKRPTEAIPILTGVWSLAATRYSLSARLIEK